MYISEKWKFRFGKRKFTGNRTNGKKKEKLVLILDEQYQSYKREFKTEAELLAAAVKLFDGQVISVKVEKRAPKWDPFQKQRCN